MYTINLSSNQFTGSVPPTILNSLSNCVINLNQNQLSSIPWDKWINSNALSNTSLNLGNNRLSGELSDKIYWTKEIFLNYNSFTGFIPELNITNGVPKTTSISFYSNDLSGNLPISLTQATFLENLSVPYNSNMSGEIPIQYASMPHLQALTFYGTGLTCPKNNEQWDNLILRAYVSCPYEISSYNQGSTGFVRWYIVFYIAIIFSVVAAAIFVIFFVIKSSHNKVEAVP